MITGALELREEAGYSVSNARLIGEIYPNPAIMSNRSYTVLIEQAQPTHGLKLDPGEDLITRLIPLEDAPRLVKEGKIRHAIVVVALYHFELSRRS